MSPWTPVQAIHDDQAYEREVVPISAGRSAARISRPPQLPPLAFSNEPDELQPPPYDVAHAPAGGLTPQLLQSVSETTSNDYWGRPGTASSGSQSPLDSDRSPRSVSAGTARTPTSSEEMVSQIVMRTQLIMKRNTLSKPELLYLAGVRLDEIRSPGRM